MILEGLLSIIFSILSPFVELMPDIEFNITLDSISTITSILNAGLYFVPVQTVAWILFCIVATHIMKIAIAFFKFLLDMIPFV